MKHRRWAFLTLGAVVAIAVSLAGSAAFAFYVSRFGSYNKAWGSITGAEVNAEAERSRELRRGEPAEHERQVLAKA